MKQKIIILIAVFLFSKGISIQAQQINASAGGNATGSGGTVSYTIGQQEYSSFSSVGGYVNQGVQQPYELYGCNITQPTPPVNNVCVGSTLQLSNATSGGVWSSANNRATVSQAGLLTGKVAGVATISYKVNGVTTVYSITVNAIPGVPTMAYAIGTADPQKYAPTGSFCNNKTFGVVGNPSGGVWSSTNSSVLTINCNNIVNTVGLGSATLTYTYTNSVGCTNSRSVTAGVVNCVGHRGIAIDNGQLKMDKDFTMYPNPARSTVSLQVDRLVGSGTIVVTDLYGKQVKTQSLSMGNNTVDVSNLSKGFYLVNIITSEGKTTKKLIVE